MELRGSNTERNYVVEPTDTRNYYIFRELCAE